MKDRYIVKPLNRYTGAMRPAMSRFNGSTVQRFNEN